MLQQLECDDGANVCSSAVVIGVLDCVVRRGRAMNGGLKFEDALEERLRIIRPTVDLFRRIEERRPAVLSVNVEPLIRKLQAREPHVAVYFVSGGMTEVLQSVLSLLRILVAFMSVLACPFLLYPGKSLVISCCNARVCAGARLAVPTAAASPRHTRCWHCVR